MVATRTRTVLITGTSEGGLGDALARAFHATGKFRVFATARNPDKIAHFAALGIETAALDVLSPASIEKCVIDISARTGGSLDILINNSGAGYAMPVADVSLRAARDLFDLNVFAAIEVSQAFLPLLLKSAPGSIVVNNTSIAAVAPVPLQGMYSASKAALGSVSDTMRLELAPFGVNVVDLRTGGVRSRFFDNLKAAPTTREGRGPKLPPTSIYGVARTQLEGIMSGDELDVKFDDADSWATHVVADLTAPKPSARVWRGNSAALIWFARAFFPTWSLDSQLRKLGGMTAVEASLKAERKQG